MAVRQAFPSKFAATTEVDGGGGGVEYQGVLKTRKLLILRPPKPQCTTKLRLTGTYLERGVFVFTSLKCPSADRFPCT